MANDLALKVVIRLRRQCWVVEVVCSVGAITQRKGAWYASECSLQYEALAVSRKVRGSEAYPLCGRVTVKVLTFDVGWTYVSMGCPQPAGDGHRRPWQLMLRQACGGWNGLIHGSSGTKQREFTFTEVHNNNIINCWVSSEGSRDESARYLVLVRARP